MTRTLAGVNSPVSPASARCDYAPVMADDPKKKKADGKRRSQQKHEVAYQRSKARKSGKMKKG
jgi:hypothetical protein